MITNSDLFIFSVVSQFEKLNKKGWYKNGIGNFKNSLKPQNA
mgnify:CR=1 FL=1